MPAGLKRYQHTGNLHFITFSCHERRPYLNTPHIRTMVLKTLQQTSLRYKSRLDGFVIMPEHLHLLIGEPQQGTLAGMIRSLKQSTAQQSGEGPFWYPRYYDFNVFSEEKRSEKINYMHHNPVKRGLCTTPEGWPWSSAGFALRANRFLPVA